MGINVQRRGAKFQLRVTHALLEKPFFYTAESDADARGYGDKLMALLARGVVPSELLVPEAPGRRTDPLLTQVISEYEQLAPITSSDADLLRVVRGEVALVRISGITFPWAEGYIAGLRKPEHHLAPSSIRKRVGVLSRVLQWHLNRATAAGERVPANPFDLLPDGYSLYTKPEAEVLAAQGLEVKRDRQRDHRLDADGEARVRRALAGEKREGRERALAVDPEFTMLFDLIVDTGLRLREAYRLRAGQVDLDKRVIHVDGTKGHRGVIKPRTVPMKRVLVDRLRPAIERGGLLFPTLWNGENDDLTLKQTTARLSRRFAVLFDFAGLPDFTEHDLRHEATCRWFELRDPRGMWVYDDIAICRVMGWTNTNLALRYASLRGEDLAARLPD